MLCLSLLVIIVDNSILNVALPTLAGRPRREQQPAPVDGRLATRSCSRACCSPRAASVTGSAASGALQFGMVVFGLGSLALGASRHRRTSSSSTRGVHGHRRRVHHAGDAVDHHQRVPARRARPRDLVLGRDRRCRRRARPDQRRLPARALLLGLDLPREPADRRRSRSSRARSSLPTSKDPSKPTLDPSARRCRSSGLLALVYGIIQAPDEGWTSAAILGCVRRSRSSCSARSRGGSRTRAIPMLDTRCSRTRASPPRASASC